MGLPPCHDGTRTRATDDPDHGSRRPSVYRTRYKGSMSRPFSLQLVPSEYVIAGASED